MTAEIQEIARAAGLQHSDREIRPGTKGGTTPLAQSSTLEKSYE
ncbi:hypothetical protein [Aurantiacibacter marinus]|nr:hypothetical protein [Aurantiacibacter marinus]